MRDPAKRRATYDDLLAVPEHFVAEIIDGALVTMPRPASRAHARAPRRERVRARARLGLRGALAVDGRDRPRRQDADYAREAVEHLWLVDPIAKTLEASHLEDGRWVLLGTWRDDAKVRVAPFDAFELELAGLWAK